MSLSLLLPWFPILLGVGAGGRLLGRTRGLGLGVLGAIFWILVVQASIGPTVWRDGWAIATILAGAFAIAAMGAWSGEAARLGEVSDSATSELTDGICSHVSIEAPALASYAEVLHQFDEFVATHRLDQEPWPAFGELVRRMLYQVCRATHVRPYRLTNEGRELAPLVDTDSFASAKRLRAADGVVGQVLATGRAYVESDGAQAVAGSSAASVADGRLVWCFPILQANAPIGVVVVGHLEQPAHAQRQLLETTALMVSQFWCSLQEVCRSRGAVVLDPASGALTREAFLAAAESALAESAAQDEPVALAVIALEGLRELNDSGRWELVDDLLREVGQVLRGKLRHDDRLGRFDGSRFVILMRRVDHELSARIVRQILTKLTLLCGDGARWRKAIQVRAGIAGAGDDVDLRALVSRSLTLCQQARIEQQSLIVECAPSLAAATSDP